MGISAGETLNIRERLTAALMTILTTATIGGFTWAVHSHNKIERLQFEMDRVKQSDADRQFRMLWKNLDWIHWRCDVLYDKNGMPIPRMPDLER